MITTNGYEYPAIYPECQLKAKVVIKLLVECYVLLMGPKQDRQDSKRLEEIERFADYGTNDKCQR